MSENGVGEPTTVVLNPADIVRKMTGGNGVRPHTKPTSNGTSNGATNGATTGCRVVDVDPEPSNGTAWSEEGNSFIRPAEGKVHDYIGPLGLGLYADGPICHHCTRSRYPGILWPVSSHAQDGEVRACPMCQIFTDHSKAAFFLSAVLGIPIAQGDNGIWYTPLPEELMLSMARALRIGSTEEKLVRHAETEDEDLESDPRQTTGD